MKRLFDVFTTNRNALADYQPRPYNSKVLLCCAESVTGDRGWDAVLTGDYETIQIPGDHYEMMRSPHVQILAQTLAQSLEKNS